MRFIKVENLDKCLSHMGDRFVISFVGVDVFDVII